MPEITALAAKLQNKLFLDEGENHSACLFDVSAISKTRRTDLKTIKMATKNNPTEDPATKEIESLGPEGFSNFENPSITCTLLTKDKEF